MLCLIAQSRSASVDRKLPPRKIRGIVSTDETIRRWEKDREKEERHIFRIVLMMCLIAFLPAVLMILNIIFNPDALQYDINPRQDFSSWYPGK